MLNCHIQAGIASILLDSICWGGLPCCPSIWGCLLCDISVLRLMHLWLIRMIPSQLFSFVLEHEHQPWKKVLHAAQIKREPVDDLVFFWGLIWRDLEGRTMLNPWTTRHATTQLRSNLRKIWRLKNKWRFWSRWLGQGHRKHRKLSAGVIPQTRKWKGAGAYPGESSSFIHLRIFYLKAT